MWWLTLRQHKVQIVVTASCLFVVGLILLWHGVATSRYLADRAPAGCPATTTTCQSFERDALLPRWAQMQPLLNFLLFAPFLIGGFWGSPLVGQEYERGTTKFVFTQSVTVDQWVVAKISLLGALVGVGGLAVGGMVSAWLSVFHGTSLPGVDTAFSLSAIRGVAPAAWWILFFTIGAASGALFRRVLPSIAVTFAALFLITYATVRLFNVIPLEGFWQLQAIHVGFTGAISCVLAWWTVNRIRRVRV